MEAKRIGLVLPVLAGVLAGCAKNPDAIAPITMAADAYAGLSCDQLAIEHRRSSAALATVSQQQEQAASGDAVGVFLIGVPVSSLSGGDKEGLVARHKGEIVAIEGAMRARHCAVAEPEAAAPAIASPPSVTLPPPQ